THLPSGRGMMVWRDEPVSALAFSGDARRLVVRYERDAVSKWVGLMDTASATYARWAQVAAPAADVQLVVGRSAAQILVVDGPRHALLVDGTRSTTQPWRVPAPVAITPDEQAAVFVDSAGSPAFA